MNLAEFVSVPEAAKILGLCPSTTRVKLGKPDAKYRQRFLFRKSRVLELKSVVELEKKTRVYGKAQGIRHNRRGESKLLQRGLEEVSTVRYCKTRVCRAPGCTNHPRVNCLYCDDCGPKYQSQFEEAEGALI